MKTLMRFTLALWLALPVLASAGDDLEVVEPAQVCMMNDKFFGTDQIPVDVGGKTYYGCCEMCKERLTKSAAHRNAVDPVSGNPVDKATAVIAKRSDGSVLYFESKATLAKYGDAGN